MEKLEGFTEQVMAEEPFLFIQVISYKKVFFQVRSLIRSLSREKAHSLASKPLLVDEALLARFKIQESIFENARPILRGLKVVAEDDSSGLPTFVGFTLERMANVLVEEVLEKGSARDAFSTDTWMVARGLLNYLLRKTAVRK